MSMKAVPEALFRQVMALYLTIHFAQLIPWAGELFSNRGVIPDPFSSPFVRFFPNLLVLCGEPFFASLILSCGVVCSLLLMFGIQDRWMALGIWYIWACLYGRNPLIANPSLPFVGWLLLAHACGGGSKPIRQQMIQVAWIILSVSYSYSGITKLISPSWMNGSALQEVLESPLARPTAIREWILQLPPAVLRFATHGVLIAEIAFAPLALIRNLRPLLWGLFLALHLSLIVMLDFADLSFGMILIHLYVIDPGVRRTPDYKMQGKHYFL